MKDRENALRIINFDQPARVMMGVPVYGIAYFGCNHEGYQGGGHDVPVGTEWVDIWGTGWRKEQEGVMGFPWRFPLPEPAALRGYRWPDPDDERICAPIYRQAAAFPRDDRFLMGSHRNLLWEKAYKLVDMENLMVYFYTEPGFAREVLHRIMDFQLGIARHYLAVGVEFVRFSEDLGTQQALILGPDIIEEFLVPEYRRIFNLYRAAGVKIIFHTCGKVEPLLTFLMDLGVDVLNPVQATANDLAYVRRVTQGRMALEGGVSTHTVMTGPPERIAAEVREKIQLLGAQGGYFCLPDQSLPFPPEHRRAFTEAVAKYGSYPVV